VKRLKSFLPPGNYNNVIGSGIDANNGDLGVVGGGPSKFEMGEGTCLGLPNIWKTRYTHFIYYDQPPIEGRVIVFQYFRQSTFQMMKLLKKSHQEFWVQK